MYCQETYNHNYFNKGVVGLKAAIVGVSGYTGLELVRLIHLHPVLELGTLHSHSLHKKSEELYPHLRQIYEQAIEPYDAKRIIANNDVVFFATPAGVSKDAMVPFMEAGFPVVDLSGDLRLQDPEMYKKWYKREPAPKEVLQAAAYCLPEFYEETGKNFISNPGCYATAAILAVAPLIKAGLVKQESLIFDGKSGLSGAGKKLTASSHFVNVDENMVMYKINQHQHIPEIIQQLNTWDPQIKNIQFTTSLIPVKRGIFMTCYAQLKPEYSMNDITSAFAACYEGQPFVRMQPVGEIPELRQVTGTNFCDIGLSLNEGNNMLTVVSVLDNLVKGAAGQAIQNYNKWAGLEETAGLIQIPLFP